MKHIKELKCKERRTYGRAGGRSDYYYIVYVNIEMGNRRRKYIHMGILSFNFNMCGILCPARYLLIAYHSTTLILVVPIRLSSNMTRLRRTKLESLHKSWYANPLNPILCFFLALGCWISLESGRLKTAENLFIISGSKRGTASQRYCTQLYQRW